MGLESASHIDELVTTNPVGATDPKSQGDDHIRMIKDVLKTDFPDVDQATSNIFATATAPPLAIGGTVWFDTTANLLKIRDEGDTAWITLAVSITADNTVDIDGGAIDGTVIGGTTPSTGVFTQVDSDNIRVDGNTISSTDTNGDINLTPDGSGAVKTDNLSFDGNTIASTDAAGDINLTPDTTGDVVLDGVKWPQADGTLDQVLLTDGAGQTSWQNSGIIASQAEAQAGTENTKTMSALRVAEAIKGYGGQPEIFTGNGTYNVPDGVTQCKVEQAGGGGGGAGKGGASFGGGGGSGGYMVALVTVTPGGTETVTIGALGAGSTGGGAAGGATTFGSLVTTNGGGGGVAAGGGGGAGGSASTTETRIYGGSGNAGGTGASVIGGNGGGHRVLDDIGGPGENGNGGDGANLSDGGGGGGASGTTSGGDGVGGYCIVTPLL